MPSPAHNFEHHALHADITGAIGGYFRPNAHLQFGESDSAHGVTFGSVDPYGDVAVKPFLREKAAQHESSVLRSIREKGMRTLEPLTVATGSLGSYLVTRYEPGLTHLGQVPWNIPIASKQLQREVLPNLQVAADSAGQLHSRAISHGDMRAKNLAFDRTGQQVVVDVERGYVNRAPVERTLDANRDLGTFGLSVLSRGLLEDRTTKYRARFLGENFLDPALATSGTEGFVDPPEVRRQDIQGAWVNALEQGGDVHAALKRYLKAQSEQRHGK